jgi:hypothetical protein
MSVPKQSSLILYLVVLLGFVVGFLFNNQSDPTANVPTLDARFQLTSLRGLERVRIDDSLLQTEQFKALRIFGQLPVQAVGGGKSDPFQ